MQIAVQGNLVAQQGRVAENDFLLQVLLPLVQKQHVNLLFFVSSAEKTEVLTAYGQQQLLSPPGFLPIKNWAQQWKFSQQIPGVLKKQQIPFYISNQQAANSPTPQLLVVTTPQPVSFANKNGKIIVTTQWAATQMQQEYQVPAEKIQVIPAAPSPLFQALQWEQSEAIKAKYTDGCEYFVLDGSLAQLSQITYALKAFSVFKKWQKSSMKLVITGVDNSQLPDIEAYKFRNDLMLLPDAQITELTSVLAGAYAMIYPVETDATAIPALHAMASEVPVIAMDIPAHREIGAETFLYADTQAFNSLGQLMIQLYKDESLRSRLALAGKNRVASNSWQQSADILWQTIKILTS
ncbi:Glycosyltransferase involved in cell wall bisynthesis [Filimonas lacunae]|uniref:Glycosyltransferase involved in cell wall bisynthesis n=1 Tax=Filimonas lacunae TaxID=477680 RepID=A0A173MQV6_9BACT|nr:glycosyltransferase [Filimonas lacunae]BAV09876.1 glycosyl transferase, group 1 [Filimonas lacunae]SIS80347.1 Glycosyltransferase involved in cell wall bisynthesis [Filimonas lacunae]